MYGYRENGGEGLVFKWQKKEMKEEDTMKSLYIIIPAYNESANIREVIREWYPIVEKRNAGAR